MTQFATLKYLLIVIPFKTLHNDLQKTYKADRLSDTMFTKLLVSQQ